MIRRLLLLACPLVLVAQDAPPPAAPAAPAAAPAEQILRPPEPGRFAELFRRFRTEQAALSPDGSHIAYSVREGEELFVITLDLDHPETIKARVKVIDDDAATPMLAANQREKTPGNILWLGWATPNRVVVQTNEVHTRISATTTDAKWSSWTGTVLGFDADGGNARKLASPEDLVEVTFVPGANNPFSTRRPSLASPIAGVWTPDQQAPVTATESETGLALPGEETETTDPAATADPTVVQPRSLRIFDLDPKTTGGLRLVADGAPRENGVRSLSFHSLNALTGKLVDLNDTQVQSNQSTLIDRQGRARLSIPNTTVATFPFRYEYFGAEGRNRGKPLDDAVGFTGFSVSPSNYFGERAIPLGFDEDPNILYYAANLGRDTYGLYSLNLATKQRGALTLENPAYDLIGPPGAGFPPQAPLVFDRFTHKLAGVRFQANYRTAVWLRPELQGAQAELEKALPGRSVELLDWDEKANRFLVVAEGPADPGAFYVYRRDAAKLTEIVRRAPWVDANHVHTTLPFGFALADGTKLTGFITAPATPRMKPIPMIVLCPEEPWDRVSPGFQRDVHALAGMGFAVVQFNGRGAWGLGRKQREAITTGYDLTQVEDVVTIVTALAQRFQVNPKRVALLGRGHGGFIALRALQMFPDLFRCAVALEPPVDIGDWLANMKWTEENVEPQLTRAWLGNEARLKAAPLARQPEAVTKPVLVLSYPGLDGTPRRPIYLAARRFVEDVAKRGVAAELADLHNDYVQGLPAARAEVFDRIEAFLNEHIYDYKVKLRDLKILPDKKP
ncbi:MAG TPA: alpha/beta fold hydrolase [Lacunisphaera sp.]|nr:alpha/beta fold hydrolase [Lacunisphaera sp.]